MTTEEQFIKNLADIVEKAHKELHSKVEHISGSLDGMKSQINEILLSLKGSEMVDGLFNGMHKNGNEINSLKKKVEDIDVMMKVRDAEIKGAKWMAAVFSTLFGSLGAVLGFFIKHIIFKT